MVISPSLNEKMMQELQKELYTDRCTIHNLTDVTDPESHITYQTDEQYIVNYSNIPCLLVVRTSTEMGLEYYQPKVKEVVKLFLDSKYKIKNGSKVIVTKQGITRTYMYSGESRLYSNHQEIFLELVGEYV